MDQIRTNEAHAVYRKRLYQSIVMDSNYQVGEARIVLGMVSMPTQAALLQGVPRS